MTHRFGVRGEGARSQPPADEKIRYIDKLVDGLAKGRPLDKVLRI